MYPALRHRGSSNNCDPCDTVTENEASKKPCVDSSFIHSPQFYRFSSILSFILLILPNLYPVYPSTTLFLPTFLAYTLISLTILDLPMAPPSKTSSYNNLTTAEKKARTRAWKKAEEEAENQRLIGQVSGEYNHGLLEFRAYCFCSHRTTISKAKGH